MTALTNGLLKLITVGLLCGFALSLGGKGPQREILRFGFACLMLVVLLSLVRNTEVRWDALELGRNGLETAVEQTQRETRQDLLTRTEQGLGEELERRAAELSLNCQITVDCQADETGAVAVTQVSIIYQRGPREALAQLRQTASDLLEISQAQIIICEEETP